MLTKEVQTITKVLNLGAVPLKFLPCRKALTDPVLCVRLVPLCGERREAGAGGAGIPRRADPRAQGGTLRI